MLCPTPCKGCLCCELSVSSPSDSEVPPQGSARAGTHTYLFILSPLFPKERDLRLPQVSGRLFQLCAAGEGGRALCLHTGGAFYGALNDVSVRQSHNLVVNVLMGVPQGSGARQTPQARLRGGQKYCPWFLVRWQSVSLRGLRPQHWMLSRPWQAKLPSTNQQHI